MIACGRLDSIGRCLRWRYRLEGMDGKSVEELVSYDKRRLFTAYSVSEEHIPVLRKELTLRNETYVLGPDDR